MARPRLSEVINLQANRKEARKDTHRVTKVFFAHTKKRAKVQRVFLNRRKLVDLHDPETYGVDRDLPSLTRMIES